MYKYLQKNVVPVVRGAAKYSTFVPHKWYINTAHFKSPQHLANYLKHLRNNPEEYLEYLKYRDQYDSTGYYGIVELPGWCELCARLNDPNEEPKMYLNISKWWEKQDCQEPHDLPGLNISIWGRK